MLTYFLMTLITLVVAITAIWGIRYNDKKNSFMSMRDTVWLRGLWCLIIMLVHVPENYRNVIQDMIGSLAYIGVSFFFMTSAYGLKHGMKYKDKYMNKFGAKRLPNLLIPVLMVNLCSVLVKLLYTGEVNLKSFLHLDPWVKVLLFYYVVFWLIYHVFPKLIRMRVRGQWYDVIMILFVIGCSLFNRFGQTDALGIWIVEPLGFAYGIIAEEYSSSIKDWLRNGWKRKLIILMMFSGGLGLCYLKFKALDIIGDYFLKIMLGIVILGFVFTVISKFEVGNRAMNLLGKISYEVYLMHGVVYAALVYMFGNGINSGFYILMSLIVTIVCALFLNALSSFFCAIFLKRIYCN